MEVFARELGLSGCRPSSASGSRKQLEVRTVVKRPRSSAGQRRPGPELEGHEQCMRCEKTGVVPQGSGSFFCEDCFGVLAKRRQSKAARHMDGPRGHEFSADRRATRHVYRGKLEKSFLVEMVSKRHKPFTVRMLSTTEKNALQKKKDMKYKLKELEKVFGLSPAQLKRRRNVGNKPMRRRRNAITTNFGKQGDFAATDVQRVFRGFAIRRKQKSLYRTMSAIQSRYRGWQTRKAGELERRREQRDAAIKVQAVARQKFARRIYQDAYLERQEQLRQAEEERQQRALASAVVLQRQHRRISQRTMYKTFRRAVVSIQALHRAHVGRGRARAVLLDYEKKVKAARTIQKSFRCFASRCAIGEIVERKLRLKKVQILQRVFRAHLARVQVRLAKLQVSKLKEIWRDIEQRFESEKFNPLLEGSGALTEKLEFDQETARMLHRRHAQDLDEAGALVQVGLFMLAVELQFERAVSIFQTQSPNTNALSQPASSNEHGDDESDSGEDPRVLYGLALALKLCHHKRTAPGYIQKLVLRAKALDKRAALAARPKPLALFGPEAYGTSYRPCLYEIDFYLRRAQAHRHVQDTPQEMALRMCCVGAHRQHIDKDRHGAEFFYYRALALSPSDPFVLACFYGRDARATSICATKARRGTALIGQDEILPAKQTKGEEKEEGKNDERNEANTCVAPNATSLDQVATLNTQDRLIPPLCVSVEEFDQYLESKGRMKPVFSRTKMSIRSCSNITVRVFERVATSKWGEEHGAFDLLFEISSPDRGTPMFLPLSFDQIFEWAKFQDQPRWVRDKSKLYPLLVEGLDLVRTKTGPNDVAPAEGGEWAALTPALRFIMTPIGSAHRITPSSHSLSIKCFLENCHRLRVVAFCESLQESFDLHVDKGLLERLCMDSPHMQRMFQRYGWRNAAAHCQLVNRVVSLINLVPIVKSKRKPKNAYDIDIAAFTKKQENPDPLDERKEAVLINNKIVHRKVQSLAANKDAADLPEMQMVLCDLEPFLLGVRREWAAQRLQGLYHTFKAKEKARAQKRVFSALQIQRRWRGHVDRVLFKALYEELLRHKSATKLAAIIRGYQWRARWARERLCYVMASSNIPTWCDIWQTLWHQRCRGSVMEGTDATQAALWRIATSWELVEERQKTVAWDDAKLVSTKNPLMLFARALGNIIFHEQEEEGEDEEEEREGERVRSKEEAIVRWSLELLKQAFAQGEASQMIHFYSDNLFRRSSRIRNESPSALAAFAVVLEFVFDKQAQADHLLARALALTSRADQHAHASAIASRIKTRRSIRLDAAVRVQRFWRNAATLPMMFWNLAASATCAEMSYDIHAKTNKEMTNLDEMSTFVFTLHALKQDLVRAEQVYQEFMTLQPTHPDFVFGLAILLEMQLRHKEARQMLKRGFGLDPGAKCVFNMHSRFFNVAPIFHRSDPVKKSLSFVAKGIIHLLAFKDVPAGLKSLRLSLESNPSNVLALKLFERHLAQPAALEHLARAKSPEQVRAQQKREQWLVKKGSVVCHKQLNRKLLTQMNRRKSELGELLEKAADEHKKREEMERRNEALERIMMGKHDLLTIKNEAHAQREEKEKLLTSKEIAELRKKQKLKARKTRMKRSMTSRRF